MATTNYSWSTPTVNGSSDTWGSTLNTTIEAIDTQVYTVATTASAALVKSNNLSDLTSASTARTNLGFSTLTDYVTLTGTQTLTNKTLTTPIIATISNTGTLTLPTSTDTLVGRATTDTLTNKTLTSPTVNTPTISGGTVKSRVPFSSETTGTLTSASANTTVPCSGGITLDDGVFTAGDYILFDPGTSSRTFTRASGLTMMVNGTDSASATLTANMMGSAHWRSASVVVLSGAFS